MILNTIGKSKKVVATSVIPIIQPLFSMTQKYDVVCTLDIISAEV